MSAPTQGQRVMVTKRNGEQVHGTFVRSYPTKKGPFFVVKLAMGGETRARPALVKAVTE